MVVEIKDCNSLTIDQRRCTRHSTSERHLVDLLARPITPKRWLSSRRTHCVFQAQSSSLFTLCVLMSLIARRLNWLSGEICTQNQRSNRSIWSSSLHFIRGGRLGAARALLGSTEIQIGLCENVSDTTAPRGSRRSHCLIAFQLACESSSGPGQRIGSIPKQSWAKLSKINTKW